MQPARLGARKWCLSAATLLGTLVLASPSNAQAVLETPQQTNERIKEVSAAARTATPAHDYVIGRGDLLAVEVFDVPELTRDLRVSQTGTVGFPLLPVRMHLAGLTEIQAQEKVAEVLEANGLVSHPMVTVTVKEKKSKPITIVGAVIKPVVYESERPITVLEAIAQAGGIANDAGDTVIVTRPDQVSASTAGEPPEITAEDLAGVPGTGAASPTAQTASTEPPPLTNTITLNLNDLLELGDMRNNIYVQGGDIVTIPHAGIVYVLGAVTRPGGFVVTNDRNQLSTLKALALAGGLITTAKKDHAVIIRKDATGQQHQVEVDLGRILKQETEDVRLQASDILYVPQSGRKAALIRAAEIGLGIGTAVAIFRVANR